MKIGSLDSPITACTGATKGNFRHQQLYQDDTKKCIAVYSLIRYTGFFISCLLPLLCSGDPLFPIPWP
ncbi:MAG: hypothetical protein F6K26_05680 [Moorea sp. SIO2I5]|nr:hypothetical protein [Moorena sp. SIO2I5]